MHNKVIGVSTFGINDGIYIDDKDIGIKDFIPNVVIEDSVNKVFMYSNSSKFDKTGLCLDRDSYDASKVSRQMVSVLWQKLEECDDKSTYASLLYKYIVETIKECINSKEDLKNSISLSDIKKNYILVLCIPDTCGVGEQDALLHAFSGYNIKIVWRSIATLLAYFERSDIPKVTNNDISVLYFGPDSIDVITYGIDLEFLNGKTYLVPKRDRPVYERGQIDLNGTDLSISICNELLNKQILNCDQKEKSKIINQILYRFSSVWGGDSKNDINTVFYKKDNIFAYKILDLNIDEIVTRNINNSSAKDEFYLKNKINNLVSKENKNYDLFEKLYKEIARKCESSIILCSGPLSQSKIISDNIIDRLSNLHHSKDFCVCSNMAYGAVVFAERTANNEPTYKEKIDKFTYIVANNDSDSYIAKTLLEEKYITPTETYRSEPQRLKLSQGAEELQLYVSTDNNFNQVVLDAAKKIPFKYLGVKVLTATPLRFKHKVKKDIPVDVVIEQKLLSGYLQVVITPLSDNEYIDRYGIKVPFDKEHQTVYEGILDIKPTAYADYILCDLDLSSIDIDKLKRLSNKKDCFVNTFNKKTIKKHYYNKYDTIAPIVKDFIDRYNEPFEDVVIGSDFRHYLSNFILIDDCRVATHLKKEIYNEVSRYKDKIKYVDKDYIRYLLDAYIMLIGDKKDLDEFMKLFAVYREIGATAFLILQMCKRLVVQNPRLFNVKSKQFYFPEDLLTIMSFNSRELVSNEEHLKSYKFKDGGIVGKNKLNVAVSCLIYSLWYRKSSNGKNYLCGVREIDELNSDLDTLMLHWRKELIKVQRYNDNYDIFIKGLEKLCQQLKELVQKRGGNPNILSDVESLL